MWHFEQHRKIIQILEHLDANFLRECQTYFGGGTLVSLRHNEHRLSNDIDLVCSMDEGYPKLRHELYEKGFAALFPNIGELKLPRELQVNQYAVRFPVVVEDLQIRFEIVAEGQLKLGRPKKPSWCPIACINIEDSYAQKLMANADRWPDSRLYSRDLIDLCIQRLVYPIPESSIKRSEKWYPVLKPLVRAIERFQESESLRRDCYELLRVRNPRQIANGLDLLAIDLGLPKLNRFLNEQEDELERILNEKVIDKLSSDALIVLEKSENHFISLEDYQIYLCQEESEIRIRETGKYFPVFISKLEDDKWKSIQNYLSDTTIYTIIQQISQFQSEKNKQLRGPRL